MIRRCKHSPDGWNHGDLDTAFQLFSCGMVWDGNVGRKASRAHLVRHGYAVRTDGMTALTGKGAIAFLLTPRVWLAAYRRRRLFRSNPFVASTDTIDRAMR